MGTAQLVASGSPALCGVRPWSPTLVAETRPSSWRGCVSLEVLAWEAQGTGHGPGTFSVPMPDRVGGSLSLSLGGPLWGLLCLGLSGHAKTLSTTLLMERFISWHLLRCGTRQEQAEPSWGWRLPPWGGWAGWVDPNPQWMGACPPLGLLSPEQLRAEEERSQGPLEPGPNLDAPPPPTQALLWQQKCKRALRGPPPFARGLASSPGKPQPGQWRGAPSHSGKARGFGPGESVGTATRSEASGSLRTKAEES